MLTTKKGFTLVEILVAVMIVTMLVTMAVPMYEKTVEKSRMAEARTNLINILNSKLRTLDNFDKETYATTDFGFKDLDVALVCDGTCGAGAELVTKDFKYVLNPSFYPNAVCAVRRKGDNAGTQFLYLGPLEQNNTKDKFLCSGAKCDAYGMTNQNKDWCRL